jgi:predicted MFS family arabinose efflux permease
MTPVGETVVDQRPRAGRYVIFLLMIITLVNYLDRQVLTILLEPIKAELRLSDTQLGVLTGLFFSLFYAFAGLPMARLSDTREQRSIISLCMVAWSIATGLCGLAQNFVQLAITRALVGIGEAGTGPAMSSVTGELFEPARRSRVFASISAASAIGIGLSVFLGGLLSEHLGWRVVFYIMAAPGLIVALLTYLTLPPSRRNLTREPPPSMRKALTTLLGLKGYRTLLAFSFCASAPGFAVMAWMPSLLIRALGMPATQVGAAIGGALTLGALSGNVVCGAIGPRLAAKDIRRLPLMMAVAQFATVPMTLGSIWAGNATLTVVLFGLTMFCSGFWGPATQTLSTGLATPHTRAVAASMIGVVISVGGAIGPVIVGALSDGLTPTFGTEAIRYGMSGVLVFGLGSAALAFALSRTIRDEFERPEAPDSRQGGDTASLSTTA